MDLARRGFQHKLLYGLGAVPLANIFLKDCAMGMDSARCVMQSHGGKWSWKRWLGVPAMVVLGAALLAAQGLERSNRVSQALNSAEVVTVGGTVHPHAWCVNDLARA